MKRVSKLQAESHRAFQAKDYPAAISALKELEQLAPGNPSVLYDLSCALALTGDKEQAIAYLQKATENGFQQWRHASEDPDLESIRDDDRTKNVIAKMKEDVEKDATSRRDPYAAVSPEPCPSTKSLTSILRYFAPKREQLRKEGFLSGPWPLYRTDWRYLRGQIDALKMYIETRPNAKDAPEAYLKIVETYCELHRPVGFNGLVLPGTAKRMRLVVEEFVAAYPDNSFAREARYVLYSAELEAAMTETWASGKRDTNAWQEVVQRLGGAFVNLADESGGEKTEGLALCKVLHLGYESDKPDMQARLVARLSKSMDDHKEVRTQAWEDAPLPLFAEMGTPDFSERDMDGVVRKLEDYRGKLLVLDFWATWCGPCMRELPEVKALHDEFAGKGVEFLGVALEDRKSMPLDKFKAWCEAQGVTWPQVYGGKVWKHPMRKAFHVRGVPTLIFIDREGKITGEGRAHSGQHWIRKELGLPPPNCHGSTNGLDKADGDAASESN